MLAAFSIAVLFTLFFVIVRLASVAMRITGLPDHVARFQCISALTGTGFTTGESEMIVNYPVRRKILVALMVVGNLGLISVAGTFIVSMMEVDANPAAIAGQAGMMALAVGITWLIMSNKTMDHVMCGLIGKVLLKMTFLGERHYQRLLQLDNGESIAEHQYCGIEPICITKLSLSVHGLILLCIKGKAKNKNGINERTMIYPDDVLIVFGKDEAHDRLDLDLPHS